MEYVLVNKFDEIVDLVELASSVGKTGATTYFQGMKQMPNRKDFDKLWKVMSKQEYDSIFKTSLQNRQMGNRKYEWWKDEESYLDADAPITESGEFIYESPDGGETVKKRKFGEHDG